MTDFSRLYLEPEGDDVKHWDGEHAKTAVTRRNHLYYNDISESSYLSSVLGF